MNYPQPEDIAQTLNQGPDKQLYATLADGTQVFTVDGESVRNNYDVDFDGGGHHLVYDFIPLGEIWLEKTDKYPTKFLFTHEIVELILMKQGMDYDTAHEFANSVEAVIRMT